MKKLTIDSFKKPYVLFYIPLMMICTLLLISSPALFDGIGQALFAVGCSTAQLLLLYLFMRTYEGEKFNFSNFISIGLVIHMFNLLLGLTVHNLL